MYYEGITSTLRVGIGMLRGQVSTGYNEMILFEDIMILQWLSQVKLDINDGGTFSQNKRKPKAIHYVHEQAGKSKSSKH